MSSSDKKPSFAQKSDDDDNQFAYTSEQGFGGAEASAQNLEKIELQEKPKPKAIAKKQKAPEPKAAEPKAAKKW